MSTITCSLLNGEEITIDFSENTTPEKVVKSYFQTKRGWDEREIEVRFISENNYYVILDTFSDKFIRTCRVKKTQNIDIADKNKVQNHLLEEGEAEAYYFLERNSGDKRTKKKKFHKFKD